MSGRGGRLAIGLRAPVLAHSPVRFGPNRRRTLSGPATQKLISPGSSFPPELPALRQDATRPCDVASSGGLLRFRWLAVPGCWHAAWMGQTCGDRGALKNSPVGPRSASRGSRPGCSAPSRRFASQGKVVRPGTAEWQFSGNSGSSAGMPLWAARSRQSPIVCIGKTTSHVDDDA